jgi:hypothetical protein
MMIFYCSDCNRQITGADSETVGQILQRLEKHVTKCPLATFTFEGTTELARRREEGLRAFLHDAQLEGKIRLQ